MFGNFVETLHDRPALSFFLGMIFGIFIYRQLKPVSLSDIIVHQARTPLTAILGYLELLRDGSFGPIPSAAKKTVLRIIDRTAIVVSFMHRSISSDDFVGLSPKLKRELIEWDSFVQSIIEDYSTRTNGREACITAHIALNLPEITIDQSYVRSAIMNLVDNAINHAQTGNIRIEVSTKDNDLNIAVIDNGTGFSRVDLAFTRTRLRRLGIFNFAFNFSEHGLGLYFVQWVTKLHGGSLRIVNNQSGYGSTVSFSIKDE